MMRRVARTVCCLMVAALIAGCDQSTLTIECTADGHVGTLSMSGHGSLRLTEDVRELCSHGEAK